METKRSVEDLKRCIALVEERIDGVKDKHIHYEQINVYGEQLTELYKELHKVEGEEPSKEEKVVKEKPKSEEEAEIDRSIKGVIDSYLAWM